MAKSQHAKWHQMVRAGEGLQIEFKSRAPKLVRIAKTLSSFSNSSGGTVFFGVDDNGEIVGLDHVQGTKDLIKQVAEFYCNPPANIALHDWEPLPGVNLVVLEVAECDDKPLYAINPQNEEDTWPYFRSDCENLPLDKKSIKTMGSHTAETISEHDLQDLGKHAVTMMEHLNKTPRRTVNELAKAPNISVHRAKKILVKLEQRGWVHSFFNEKRREYSLAVPWKKK